MSEKMKNIPKKRFLEFVNNGEWEEKELFEIIDFKSGYAFSSSKMSNKVQQYQLIKMSNVYQNILDLDRNPSYWEKINQIESEFLLETGDVVLTLTGTVGKKDYGYSVMIEENNKFLLNQRLVRFRAINERSVSKFIRNLVLHENFLNSFFINSRGGTGNQSNVSIEDLKQIKLPIPSLAEQQKIADCLSSVDSLILAQSQKVELLKKHKKGLMQQLFPSEGESVPRLRFPEFVNDGEWEEKRLGEIVEILNNRRMPISSDLREKGLYPYYGASGIVDYIKDYIFDERLLLIGEDGAKWGAYENTAFIAKGKYWVNNHAHVLKTTKINDVLLQNYLNMLDISPFITGAAPPKLTLKNLKDIIIPLAKPNEQQKIADCLSSLDEQISQQTSKLQTLKEHKKALMQNLFPKSEVNR